MKKLMRIMELITIVVHKKNDKNNDVDKNDINRNHENKKNLIPRSVSVKKLTTLNHYFKKYILAEPNLILLKRSVKEVGLLRV